jgi:DNA repair photolyase
MIVREVKAKTILSASKIRDYVINPYIGCQHGCSYCYARFMKRFTGHLEPWGEFVDVKINAAELLQKEILKKKRGEVWVSGVCDPYQPLEAKYLLTRKCLELLAHYHWPAIIQTRSPMVLRDIDIIKAAPEFSVGFSITTADDNIRRLFELNAPPIKARINALAVLHQAGIKTYAMIAPVLPGAETIVELIEGKVDYLLIDRMNYNNAGGIYKNNNLEYALTNDYCYKTAKELTDRCRETGIDCEVLF